MKQCSHNNIKVKNETLIDAFIYAFLIIFLSYHEPSYSDEIRTAGDILQIALPSTALGMAIAEPDDKGRVQWVESFVTTAVVTQTLKYSINRERPNGGDLSFPSGHTSSAFQGAAFIHERYGSKFGVPAYLLASFVGYSRVHAGVHYWSDVIAGAAVGIAATLYWTDSYKRKNDIMILPFIDKEVKYIGLGVYKSF
jgi:membrane-associated phospholipid phosphatase